MVDSETQLRAIASSTPPYTPIAQEEQRVVLASDDSRDRAPCKVLILWTGIESGDRGGNGYNFLCPSLLIAYTSLSKTVQTLKYIGRVRS